MNAVQFVSQQIAEAQGLLGAAISGVTDEQFNWLPPGTCIPIKSAFLHTVAGEDIFIQMILQGRPPLWATGGWAGRIGLAEPPGGGQGWEEARQAALALAPVQAYAEAVHAATGEYLAQLTDGELDRRVDMFGADSSAGGVLARLAAHIAGHAGEIAALKGMQGLQGLPF